MDLSTGEYKGFKVLSIKDVPDCNAKGIYLRHEKTGLEIYHLLNDDKENLCCFSFRTPPKVSNGVAHIIEHSALCGSEKYPLKDPFIHLENQSLNTYLNALTGCDKTMYPVSSVVEEDYFNLVSVYADSVFFPNLKREAFLQEAHRLELDENGKYSIQGVVYNEMKGVYSQFYSAESDVLNRAFFKDTIYALDAGGDPSVIPDLTYEEYLEFYKEKYTPDNCLIFLYGNIPTEKQIDFFTENFITRLEKRPLTNSAGKKNLEILQSQKITPVTERIDLQGIGPKSTENTDPSVCAAWYVGDTFGIDSFIESNVIESILFSHDGSPLRKALLNSGLGIDIDDLSGIDGGSKFRTMCFGLRGVKEKNKEKVYDLIVSEIKKVIDEGINKDDLDSALLGAEFALKEISRSSGPYSLVYLRKVVKAWAYGEEPETYLLLRAGFERFRENLKKDSRYLEKLMQKYFIDNKHSALVTITPSDRYTLEMQKKEEAQIERIKKLYTKEALLEQNKKLKEYQEKDESDLLSCLPSIDIKTVKYELPDPHAEVEYIKTASGKVPFGYSIQSTNGINYFDIRFPIDVLDPEDYFYVGFLLYAATEIGWGSKTFEQTQTIVNKYSGAFYSGTETSSVSENEESTKIRKSLEEYCITDRDWFYYRFKSLNYMTKDSLDFLSECISSPDFMDLKRISTLYKQYINDFSDAVSAGGHKFLLDRCTSVINKSKAADEVLGGISNLLYLKKQKNIKKLAKRLSEIQQKIVSSGCFIFLICDKDSFEPAKKEISDFAFKLNLSKPALTNPKNNFENLKKLCSIKKLKNSKVECFSKDIQVGFACSAFLTDGAIYGSREMTARHVFSNWLSNSLLWEQIRTICGAYGASAYLEQIEKVFGIATYRDPDPLKSISVIADCLKEASSYNFTEDEIEKTAAGVFSSDLTPKTPKSLGSIAMTRLIYCISNKTVETRVKNTLSITAKEVHEASVKVYEDYCKNVQSSVVIQKNNKNVGKLRQIKL